MLKISARVLAWNYGVDPQPGSPRTSSSRDQSMGSKVVLVRDLRRIMFAQKLGPENSTIGGGRRRAGG